MSTNKAPRAYKVPWPSIGPYWFFPDFANCTEEIHLKKLLAALVAGAFAVASVGVYAASHAGAQPMKDDTKKDDSKKKDDKKKDEAKKN
jgi:hypothetical protein